MVGIVVGKRVGGAVTRNKVKRRIRALAAARVAELPCGAGLVVRALPRAAGVSFGMLERDFATAVEAVMERSREVRR
jgi:ribonuclease P protein component